MRATKLEWFHDMDAVIFDNDGLLVNSEPVFTECFNELLAKWSIPFTMEFKAKIAGRRIEEVAHLCVNDLRIPMEVGEFYEIMLEIMVRLLPKSEMMPGAIEAIETVQRLGKKCALATSSIKELFQAVSSKHQDVYAKIPLRITGDDPEVHRGKPAPDIYLVTAKRLGMDPSKCVVLEDSTSGVKAAVAAGMRAVWIPDLIHHPSEGLDSTLTSDPNVTVLTNLNEFIHGII